METYTKINTLYKRYAFDPKTCPEKKWLGFRNKIILGDFSDKTAEYLFRCPWEAYSKIDGTNSKICYYPGTGELKVGGKTDSANSMHGQFEMLQKIGDRIKPILAELFPPESAKYVPTKEGNKPIYYEVWSKPLESDPTCSQAIFDKKESISGEGMYGVKLEESPIYIYGEYFGVGIQKGGGRYFKDHNEFHVFDIHQQGWWIPKEMRDNLCAKLSLQTVPFLGIMTLEEIEEKVKSGFTTSIEGVSDSSLIEEGIVARPTLPLLDSRGNRIIVKVKYCDYIEYQNIRSQFTEEEFSDFQEWYKSEAIILSK